MASAMVSDIAGSRVVAGAMLRNSSLKFICQPVFLKIQRNDTPFSNKFKSMQVVKIPIAHGEGNYYCDPGLCRK